MSARSPTLGALVRAWFSVTAQERRLLFGLVALFLIGLTARYLHLRHAEPVPLDAPMADETREEIRDE